jgi:hypothetical protein
MNGLQLQPKFANYLKSETNKLSGYKLDFDDVHDRDYYSDYLAVLNKNSVIVPYSRNRIQRHFIQNQELRNLIIKPRQVGFSTELQSQLFLDAITGTHRQAVLAHDDVTTSLIRRMAKRFWQQLPEHIRPKRGEDNARTTIYATTGSEVTIATAGSLNVGRGGTFNRVHGTEVAYWKDADAILAGLLQGVPPGGRVDLESTANGAQGWFYEKCMEALDGNNKYKLHFYPWWWEEGYALPLEEDEVIIFDEQEMELVTQYGLTPEQIKWRRDKIKEIPLTFEQEYPEDVYKAFLQSGTSVFGDISAALYEPQQTEPDPEHRYVAGADWGQSVDYSSISIFDATIGQEVFLDRFNRMSWEDMQSRMVDACIKWNVETFAPEANSMGVVNIEALTTKFEDKDFDINIRPMWTNNDRKRRWVTNFYRGIHYENAQLLNIGYANAEMRGFTQGQTKQGAYTYEAAKGGHDDTVICRMLGWDAVCNLIQ